MKLYRYNLDTNEIEYTNIKSNDYTMQVLSYENNIIYNQDKDIYFLNIDDNETKMILSNNKNLYLIILSFVN